MSKRKYVETGLYSELSEYSSLLRALRTTSTLDLSSHLTLSNAKGSHSTSATREEVYEDDEDDLSAILDLEEGREGQAGSSRDACTRTSSTRPLTAISEDHNSSQHERERSDEDVHMSSFHRRMMASSHRPATIRDTWTKWPLVPSEVYVPEWPMEEEVRLMATESLRRARDGGVASQQSSGGSSAAPIVDSDVMVDSSLSRATLRALTRATTKRLYEILATSAAMLPEGEDSLQNRHGYINWELVLSAMDAFGLYTPEQLEDIKQRMLILFPKYNTRRTRNPYFVDPSTPLLKDDMSFLESGLDIDIDPLELKRLWLEEQHSDRKYGTSVLSSVDRKGKGMPRKAKKKPKRSVDDQRNDS